MCQTHNTGDTQHCRHTTPGTHNTVDVLDTQHRGHRTSLPQDIADDTANTRHRGCVRRTSRTHSTADRQHRGHSVCAEYSLSQPRLCGSCRKLWVSRAGGWKTATSRSGKLRLVATGLGTSRWGSGQWLEKLWGHQLTQAWPVRMGSARPSGQPPSRLFTVWTPPAWSRNRAPTRPGRRREDEGLRTALTALTAASFVIPHGVRPPRRSRQTSRGLPGPQGPRSSSGASNRCAGQAG